MSIYSLLCTMLSTVTLPSHSCSRFLLFHFDRYFVFALLRLFFFDVAFVFVLICRYFGTSFTSNGCWQLFLLIFSLCFSVLIPQADHHIQKSSQQPVDTREKGERCCCQLCCYHCALCVCCRLPLFSFMQWRFFSSVWNYKNFDLASGCMFDTVGSLHCTISDGPPP